MGKEIDSFYFNKNNLAKEKAIELRDKFADAIREFPESNYMNYDDEGKTCAIIQVKYLLEIINGLEWSVWVGNLKALYEEVIIELEKM